MRFSRPRTVSYANVMSTLAVALSLTGSASAVTKYLLDTDVIPAGDLAGSTYGAPLIAAGAVTAEKVADGAISTSKLDADATVPKATALEMPDVLVLNFTTVNKAYDLSPTVAVFPISVTCPGDRIAFHATKTGQGDLMYVTYQRSSATLGVRSTGSWYGTKGTVTVRCLGST